MESNPTLIFHPNKSKMVKYFLIALAFFLIGIIALYGGKQEGWFGIALGGLFLIFNIVKILPNSTYIRLTNSGFEILSIYRSWFIKWNEVEQFGYGSTKGTEMVVFNYSKNHTGNKTMKYLGNAMSGAEGGFDTLGHPAQEMVKVFNDWKGKYSTTKT